MGHTLHGLSNLTDDDIVAKYDQIAASTGWSVNLLRDELLRRWMVESDAHSTQLSEDVRKMTVTMKRLTWAAVILTLVASAAAVVSVLVDLGVIDAV